MSGFFGNSGLGLETMKCCYGRLEFFADEMNMQISENTQPVPTSMITVSIEFESQRQFDYWQPLIFKEAKRKKKTGLIVIGKYGRGAAKDAIHFWNAKPHYFHSRDRILTFIIIARSKKNTAFWQIGE